jgi:hypothetical protein
MHTKHLLHSVAIKPSLELKTRSKQLLCSLPLVLALPGVILIISECSLHPLKESNLFLDLDFIGLVQARLILGARVSKLVEMLEKPFFFFVTDAMIK